MAKEETKIEIAAEPREIARERIPNRHKHLVKARILYLFTNKRRTKCDRVVLGSTQKTTPLIRFLSAEGVDAGYDFILLFDINEWEHMDANQKLAIVAHELYHCSGSLMSGWKIRGHDVEEFAAVIEEFGFYKYDVKEFGRVAQQLPLIPAESENNIDGAPEKSLARAASDYVKATLTNGYGSVSADGEGGDDDE